MRQYVNRFKQADQLAALVAGQLTLAIASRGKAVLIVAGGSTPKLFMNSLSKMAIDWPRVIVVPSDERWVDNTHPRSNERFIRENLLINQASSAMFVSLYIETNQPADALTELEYRLESYQAYPSVCVLGMGEDAHFASLFPGSDILKVALNPKAHNSIVAIEMPNVDEARVSLTLARILRANVIHLLISGTEKLTTLRKAKLPGEVKHMPIRAILNESCLEIHYTE